MSHEIEAKFKVEGFTKVRRALRNAGAEYLGTVLQTDSYYDTAEHMLRGRHCALRIRAVRRLRSGKRPLDARSLLTVKGPPKPGRSVKVRREVQTRLDDPDAVREIIDALGLKPTITLQKRRASYRLGEGLVELDELPLIGCFVEVEARADAHVLRIARKLGLECEPSKDHYVALVVAACKQRGRHSREVLFE
jgi:adenylate cyclase, class 2